MKPQAGQPVGRVGVRIYPLHPHSALQEVEEQMGELGDGMDIPFSAVPPTETTGSGLIVNEPQRVELEEHLGVEPWDQQTCQCLTWEYLLATRCPGGLNLSRNQAGASQRTLAWREANPAQAQFTIFK